MAGKTHTDETITAALDRLSGELILRGYQATLIAPVRQRPSLMVCNPKVPARTGEVIADEHWFWWPDACRIAAVTEPATAARQIIHVLHLGCDCYA